nr:hypothetical protein [Tanacetum cinerariifolium]
DVVKFEIGGNVNFEIKRQFMRELRKDTFSENKNDDAHEHVERVLDIVYRLPLGTINYWDLLKKALSKGTVHHQKQTNSLKKSATSSRKEMKFYTKPGNDIMTYSINAPLVTSIAIRSKLDKLGQDMKKLKENMHAIQVGCQNCRGAHIDKDCPLNEEVRSVEVAKYGEFGRPVPFSNEAKYHVDLPRYYTRIDNRSVVGEKGQAWRSL